VLRRFVLALIPAILAFGLIVWAIYRQDVLHQRILLESESRHVVALQEELLLSEFRAVQSDLLFLARQATLSRFLSGDVSAREVLQREYVNFALNKGIYDQIRCLDNAGQEIIRVNYRAGKADVVPQEKLQSKATRYYYKYSQSLNRGEVFVSQFDLNMEHGEIQEPINPVVRFVTPAFDTSGEKQGFVVLNFLGARLLSRMKQVSTGFRGETLLVNAQGEYLQSPAPNHEWGWLLKHPHSFRSDYPDAWQAGKNLSTGQLRVGEGLLTIQRISFERRTFADATPAPTATIVNRDDSNDLVVISFVSAAVANAHSREFLNQIFLLSLGVVPVVGLLLLYWARSGEIRKHHELQIVESESRLRQLSSMLLSTQESERRNLSRDLHDELGQQVTAIGLDLRSLAKKAGEGDSSTLLSRVIDEIDQLLRSLHEIATRVRPRVLDDLGLQDAVESLLEEYQRRTGITVEAQLDFHRRKIPATVGENVYRVLQEALANVATHAQTDEVEVMMKTTEDLLRMTVRDPGTGFDADLEAGSSRLGILGMRERVELLNGELDLQSRPGEGTQIMISVPLTEEPGSGLRFGASA
jgi:signal transduction histidine kinase